MVALPRNHHAYRSPLALWVVWQRYRNRVDSESLSIGDLMHGPNAEKSPDQSHQ